MNLPFPKWVLYGAAAGVGLIIVNRITGGRLITSAVSSTAQLPIDTVMGVSEGFFGLPDTRTTASKTQCQAAIDQGDDWTASFYCPASDWFKGVWDGR